MSLTASCPVTICGHKLKAPRHICCFFDSRDQQYEVLTPYFKEGLSQREQVFCVMEGHLVDDHLERLESARVDVASEVRTGRLKTMASDDTYLAEGRFDKARMYGILEKVIEDLRGSGHSAMRSCGDMEWALRNMPGTHALMQYESEVNQLLVDRDDATFLCVYDANRIGGRAMLDILSTHSHVVIGKAVHENPYYMTPDDYRRTFLARRAETGLLQTS